MLNWIDGVIVIVLGYYVVEGWQVGVIILGQSFISFFLSLWFAIKFHLVVGNFFGEKFGISPVWTTVLGYVSVAIVSQMMLDSVLSFVVKQVPPKLLKSRVNQWLGSLLSIINGLLITTFFLLLFLALPMRGTVKQDIRRSVIGGYLVQFAKQYGGNVTSTLDEVAQQALQFLTVEPHSKERIQLDVRPSPNQLVIDADSERIMLTLVNTERAKVGAPALQVDTKMTAVARAYSRDMFERHYFSHVSPEGKDIGDRLQAAGIAYRVSGENLAYAPDVSTAHRGLMNSEGHRRNILDPEFHRVGIGIIDSGTYGCIFTQVFAN